MTFVDTSAFYALLDRTDESHPAAQQIWDNLLDTAEPLLTTNYVIVETCALLQRRLGVEAVRSLVERGIPAVSVEWVGETHHAAALDMVIAANRRRLSVVDCSSFALMRSLHVRRAFAFDEHFREQGFETSLS